MRIIVSVSREGELGVQDLELDGDLMVGELLALLPRVMGWPEEVGYAISAYPQGKVLPPQDGLLEAGVWDGAWLIFQPVHAAAWQAVGVGDVTPWEGLYDENQDYA